MEQLLDVEALDVGCGRGVVGLRFGVVEGERFAGCVVLAGAVGGDAVLDAIVGEDRLALQGLG